MSRAKRKSEKSAGSTKMLYFATSDIRS